MASCVGIVCLVETILRIRKPGRFIESPEVVGQRDYARNCECAIIPTAGINLMESKEVRRIWSVLIDDLAPINYFKTKSM